MGSLVESCVKISKKVLYSAMGKKILPHLQFELLVAQSVNIVNKRPVAFKECLQNDCPTNLDVPSPITPELLLRGYDLPSVRIITMIIPLITNGNQRLTQSTKLKIIMKNCLRVVKN